MDRLEQLSEKIKLKNLKLNPVLSFSEIELIEKNNKILLPDEYKEFLIHVGNGGNGPPSYGLLSLEESLGQTKQFNKNNTDFLTKEFPLSDYWIWENEAEWTEDLLNKRNRIYFGNLILGTDGCGQFWSLIISGPERGHIWFIADVGAQPCAPRMKFLDWYEYWLDGGNDWWRDFKC